MLTAHRYGASRRCRGLSRDKPRLHIESARAETIAKRRIKNSRQPLYGTGPGTVDRSYILPERPVYYLGCHNTPTKAFLLARFVAQVYKIDDGKF